MFLRNTFDIRAVLFFFRLAFVFCLRLILPFHDINTISVSQFLHHTSSYQVWVQISKHCTQMSYCFYIDRSYY